MGKGLRFKKTVHKASVCSIDFEKVYMVMDRRLEEGYSAYELSFMLGRESFYVRNAENPLHTLRYSVNETNYLLLTFSDKLPSIMPPFVEDDTYHLQITSYLNERRRQVFEISKRNEGHEYILFKIIEEEDKHQELPTPLLLVPEEEVNVFLRSLIVDSWFSVPRTALDVFVVCKQYFGPSFHPRPMIRLLNYYTNRKSGTGELDKGKNEFGRQTFIEKGR